MGQKLFRDPIYDYIQIDKKYSWLLDLINCPEVQRLRYINQLGLSQFTYPGSTHTRFSHSLGVLHLMQQCIGHLEKDYDAFFESGDKEALLAASLLHDIGHSPFSHATEDFFGKHEERTVDIILNSDSEVHKVLKNQNENLPLKTAALISKKSIENIAAPVWQQSLISSQLDMDRLDYLRRDSLFTGAQYGKFDLFRIIHTTELQEKKVNHKKMPFVVWPDKTKYAIEEYIFARFYMYQNVYWHHTTRGFEKLLCKILQRAKDTVTDDKGFEKTFLQPVKLLLTKEEEKDSTKFLNLTDNVLFAQIGIWQDCEDKVLKDLSKRLMHRKVLGRAELSNKTPMAIVGAINEAQEHLNKQGLDAKYYFLADETIMSGYKPYSASKSDEGFSSANSIILFDQLLSESGFCEITEAPGLGERLRSITQSKSYTLRYYFPKEEEGSIKRLLLGK